MGTSVGRSSAHAGNGLDVHVYRYVDVATRSRQNRRVHHPRYGRLTPGVCWLGNELDWERFQRLRLSLRSGFPNQLAEEEEWAPEMLRPFQSAQALKGSA